MTDEPPNLVLELLRHIRASTDRMENDIRDIKFRLSQLEEKAQHHTSRFDRVDDRLLTIEKRFGLVDA
jgi:cell division septum initiation protein DivIVA